MATVILALVTIALEAILLQRHKVMTETHSQMLNTEDRPFEVSFFRPLKVYYSIFILAEVFAVGLLWDAVRLLNRCLEENESVASPIN